LLPVFDETNPLFESTVSTLSAQGNREVVHYVYDHLFAENLRQIQALPQMHAAWMIQAIRAKRQEVNSFISSPLAVYEAACEQNPSHFMHDLVLYLAWDRMCIWMGCLFDHQRIEPPFLQALVYLKECLMESYQHLVQNGRTKPGIYRMMEAFFFMEMREENLQHHTPSDWELLSRSFQAITPQDKLIDVPYIDEAVVVKERPVEGLSACIVASDSLELVTSRLRFASWTMERIAAPYPEWRYRLIPSTTELLTGQNSESVIVFLQEQK
jgi:hypothetical protein